MSQTLRDNPKLPKRKPLILTYEEYRAIEQLVWDRLQVLNEFLHPRMKKGLKIRAERLRNVQKKLWNI